MAHEIRDSINLLTLAGINVFHHTLYLSALKTFMGFQTFVYLEDLNLNNCNYCY